MKNLIKKVILIAVMVTGLVSMASERDGNIEIKDLNSKVIQFTLNNFDGDLQVTVKDTHDYVLYKENFEGTIYSKKYDLSELPNGIYFVELRGETKIKTIPFIVSGNKVEFNYEASKIYFKPVIVVKDKKVNITKLALDKESFLIEVYNVNSKLIYKEVLEGKKHLQRRLNLEELPSGTYYLVLRSKGKVIRKAIEI